MTFNFSEAEDRVVLLCSSAERASLALSLTRRMAGPVLEKLAKMLAETNEVAATLPAKLREEVMMMEHAQALAKVAEQAAQPAAVAMQEGAARHLLTRVDLQRQPEYCTLLFFCDGSEVALASVALDRAQLHWFVDALDRFAQRADWDFKPFQRDWLALRDEATAASETVVLH